VRFDYVASVFVNAGHSLDANRCQLRVVNCVCLAVPQPSEWQRIGNQIDAALAFTAGGFRKCVVRKSIATAMVIRWTLMWDYRTCFAMGTFAAGDSLGFFLRLTLL